MFVGLSAAIKQVTVSVAIMQLSRSEFIPFAQSKNVAWTRNLDLEIASKVHYLVLFFSSRWKLFFSPEFFVLLLNAL